MLGSSGFMEPQTTQPAAVQISNCGNKETTNSWGGKNTVSLNKKVNNA